MALEISSVLLARLLHESERAPQQEVCGLLFGARERIVDTLACRNVAADPRDAFEIDPAALIAAYRAERRGGPSIVGCYHSHPAGAPTPSARDAAAAAPDGSVWIIIAAGGARFYRAVENGAYEGRFDGIDHRIVEA